jgi:hypothetical protein
MVPPLPDRRNGTEEINCGSKGVVPLYVAECDKAPRLVLAISRESSPTRLEMRVLALPARFIYECVAIPAARHEIHIDWGVHRRASV